MSTPWTFEKSLRLIKIHQGVHRENKTTFDSKFNVIRKFKIRHVLMPVKIFFFGCIDIEIDFLREICSIGDLCITFLEAKSLENLPRSLKSIQNRIERIQERCRKVEDFELDPLSEEAFDELTKIFYNFNTDSFKKALIISIGRIAISFYKFAKIIADNEIFCKKIEHLSKTQTELVDAVRDYSEYVNLHLDRINYKS